MMTGLSGFLGKRFTPAPINDASGPGTLRAGRPSVSQAAAPRPWGGGVREPRVRPQPDKLQRAG